MTGAPTLIVFLAAVSGSDVERRLGDALAEAALDLLEESLRGDAFDSALLVTNSDALDGRLPEGVEVDRDSEATFHFGRRLASLIADRGIQRPFYVGAGGVPLLRATDLGGIAWYMRESADGYVISNNYFSADLVAFAPGDAIDGIDLPASDNILPRLLHDQAGLESHPLPRSSATQFNLDSPADLAILKLAGGGGAHLSRFLEGVDAGLDAYRALMLKLVDPQAEVLVAGRVGSQVWSHLETETACRLRVYSEERGMRAAGRDATGEARSLLAYHLREVGSERFFAEIAEMADAACIDVRPLLSHLGVDASRADRFHADLGRADEIENAFLREFVEAAAAAPIPVVLGGHSLVSGGLMLLTEAAWREQDRRVQARG